MGTNNKRHLFGFVALVLLFGMVTLAACGGQSASQGGQQTNATQTGAAQPTAADANAGGDAAAGRQVFATAGCAACHALTDEQLVGPGLKGVMYGEGHYGSKLPNGEEITDESVAKWIKEGGEGEIGQMPAHPNLTDEQLTNLVAFLKTLR